MRRILRSLAAAFVISCVAIGDANLALSADISAADDNARFLAGLPVRAESPVSELTRDEAWQQHAAQFEAAWKDLDSGQIGNIRAWSAKNLTEPRPVLFYFFSGPDYLYANAFFPSATTYVLAGLEPVGRIPDVTHLPRKSVGPALRHLEASLGDILKRSYFITLDMDSKLRETELNGTLPILYVFLARAGKTIHDVSYVTLEDDGTAKKVVSTGKEKAVRIDFSGSDGRMQTLYYFNTNLANKGVRSSSFLKFCSSLGTGDGFIKSASYLLHGDDFSDVRDFLLANSTSLLQDDTGVPVSFLKSDLWELKPFGTYTSPIGIFKHNYQSKLRGLYQDGNPTPINFGIGYKGKLNQSNLLLAVRKATKAGD
jgi:hypothetical protein